jgi:hypothetical protein
MEKLERQNREKLVDFPNTRWEEKVIFSVGRRVFDIFKKIIIIGSDA